MTTTFSMFQNPVVRGSAPEPSVFRVGYDYYLATSSVEFFAAIPIRRSTDLVHWSSLATRLLTRCCSGQQAVAAD